MNDKVQAALQAGADTIQAMYQCCGCSRGSDVFTETVKMLGYEEEEIRDVAGYITKINIKLKEVGA
jgi:hypothetical protein